MLEVVRLTGMTGRRAALSVGLSSTAYYRLAESPEFAERLEQAMAEWVRGLLHVIIGSAVQLRSWRAALALLERRVPEYAERVDLHVESAPSLEDVAAEMTEEQRATRLKELVEEMARRIAEEAEA